MSTFQQYTVTFRILVPEVVRVGNKATLGDFSEAVELAVRAVAQAYGVHILGGEHAVDPYEPTTTGAEGAVRS